MKKKNRALMADLGLLATALIWGSAFVVVKQSLDRISPYWLLAARFSIAAVVISLLFFRHFRKMTWRTVGSGVFAGVCVYLGFLAQTVGVQYTAASKNAVLTASYVVFVPFVYWMMKRRKPMLSHIMAAILCFAGVVLLLYQPGMALQGINRGDLYTVLCGLFFAVQIAHLGTATQKHDPVALTIVQMITCMALSLVVAVMSDTLPTTSLPKETWMSLLYLGLFSTLFGYLMQTVAQKYTAPSHAAIILGLECVFGCVLSVIMLGDAFTPLMWFGAALTFVAVIISERSAAQGPAGKEH